MSNKASGVKNERIVDTLRARIEQGVYKAGDFLPPERALAQEFAVSRPTLRKALGVLMEAGLLTNHPGVGTRVLTHPRLRRSIRPWKVIGLLLPDFENQFFLEITEAIEYSALQRGYQLLLCNSRRQPLVEETHIRQLAEQGVEGAILAHDPQLPFPASHSHLESAGIPYVALFSAPASANCDSVAVDDYAGANQAMRYLFSLGHREIAFCSPTDGAAPHPRQKAYQEIMTLNGLPTPEHFFIPLDALDEVHGKEHLSKVLRCSPMPTAIFAGNDRTALVLQKRLAELGISVPADLSIIGFDNLRLTEHLPVPLTTIDQPKFEMGRRAVDFLLERIEFGDALEPRKEMFEPHLVIRESCTMVSSRINRGLLAGKR